jgi:anthranilate synthase component 1
MRQHPALAYARPRMLALSEDAFVRLVLDAHAASFASASFSSLAPGALLVVPITRTLLADHLTPSSAYRRLVAPDSRLAPSFLLESVEGGERVGRYSLLGVQPIARVSAIETAASLELSPNPALAMGLDAARFAGAALSRVPRASRNPFELLRAVSKSLAFVRAPGTPACFVGGWVGYAGYDSVRYIEPDKLSFASAPAPHDCGCDVDFRFYPGVVAFDHAKRELHIVELAFVPAVPALPASDLQALAKHSYAHARARIESKMLALDSPHSPLRLADASATHTALTQSVNQGIESNLTREQHAGMVAKALEYIRAGDIFQVVLGQRFSRTSTADPFDVYRALRSINPSPYMAYIQSGTADSGCVLISSSPEILCRVQHAPATGSTAQQGSAPRLQVTNRPLAGTRKRGATPADDARLALELLADAKERAEHIMLVDLGRNDVGVVSEPGTIALPAIMEIERYSHVMHISSTVTGLLREGLDCWDALAASLPVGTISGAPKVRAMQIIDELEPIRRGPYGGGLGVVGVDGQMDIALALRTIVAPTRAASLDAAQPTWLYHLQASGGIVADSDTDAEFEETVNKSMALRRAIAWAQAAFVPR